MPALYIDRTVQKPVQQTQTILMNGMWIDHFYLFLPITVQAEKGVLSGTSWKSSSSFVIRLCKVGSNYFGIVWSLLMYVPWISLPWVLRTHILRKKGGKYMDTE